MKNPPAFPSSNEVKVGNCISSGHMGMTLRDYFAAQAMQGLISSHWCEEARVLSPNLGARELAEDAYIMADAMLKVGGV